MNSFQKRKFAFSPGTPMQSVYQVLFLFLCSSDSWSEDEDLIKNLNALLSESQKQKTSEDVFNNNAKRVSKFPKRRTKINSSDDELDSDAGSNITRGKTRPRVPNKPQRLPSAGLNSDSHGGGPLSPSGAPRSPAPHSSAPRSPAPNSSAPRSPAPYSGGAPRSPSPHSSAPKSLSVHSGGAPRSPVVPKTPTKSPTLRSTTAKKPPPVSPKPSNDSRTIHVANTPSVVFNRPAVPPKPVRKSAPLSESHKMALLDDRKRSSSLSEAQEARMASQDEICKTNSIIVLPKDDKSRNSHNVELQKSGDAEQGQITYPMSILRRKPVRPEALKSCSDVIDADADCIDLESLSGESHTSEYRDSIFESPMLKQFKKSQHFLIDQDSLPDYRKSSNTTSVMSTTESISSESNGLGYDPSILRRPRTRSKSTESSAGEESPTAKVAPRYSKHPTATNSAQVFSPPTKQKLGLKRSNAKRTKTPPSPNTKLAQHKSYDPKMLRQLKTKPSSAPDDDCAPQRRLGRVQQLGRLRRGRRLGFRTRERVRGHLELADGAAGPQGSGNCQSHRRGHELSTSRPFRQCRSRDSKCDSILRLMRFVDSSRTVVALMKYSRFRESPSEAAKQWAS